MCVLVCVRARERGRVSIHCLYFQLHPAECVISMFISNTIKHTFSSFPPPTHSGEREGGAPTQPNSICPPGPRPSSLGWALELHQGPPSLEEHWRSCMEDFKVTMVPLYSPPISTLSFCSHPINALSFGSHPINASSLLLSNQHTSSLLPSNQVLCFSSLSSELDSR